MYTASAGRALERRLQSESQQHVGPRLFLDDNPVACKAVNSINHQLHSGSSLSEQTTIEQKEVAETVTQPSRIFQQEGFSRRDFCPLLLHLLPACARKANWATNTRSS